MIRFFWMVMWCIFIMWFIGKWRYVVVLELSLLMSDNFFLWSLIIFLIKGSLRFVFLFVCDREFLVWIKGLIMCGRFFFEMLILLLIIEIFVFCLFVLIMVINICFFGLVNLMVFEIRFESIWCIKCGLVCIFILVLLGWNFNVMFFLVVSFWKILRFFFMVLERMILVFFNFSLLDLVLVRLRMELIMFRRWWLFEVMLLI